eukprot:754398-Hanusia_phi.AAC.2
MYHYPPQGGVQKLLPTFLDPSFPVQFPPLIALDVTHYIPQNPYPNLLAPCSSFLTPYSHPPHHQPFNEKGAFVEIYLSTA